MGQENNKSGPSLEQVPEGDTHSRMVCPDCGYVEYANPKIVTGALCFWEDQVLLCQRAINPRKGFWTFPGGYLELKETTAEGAAREAMEEANAQIEIDGLIGVYELPHISQIYVIHRARLLSPDFSPGIESQDVRLFHWDDIPWDNLAFSSVKWSLDHHRNGTPADIHKGEPGF
jgi:ADP-ribose pyrophosphatase YjhB (NUDIX family)